MSIDMLEIELACTTSLLLGMHHWGDILEENVDVKSHSFLFWKRHVTFWIWSWTSNEICQTYTLEVMTPEE
jgi:hypothetical protein